MTRPVYGKMVPMAIHITGDPASDQVLSDDPFALLVGMRGPAKFLTTR